MLIVNTRQYVLESVKRREALQLNQLRRQRPALVTGDGKVDLNEVWMRAFVRSIESRRDGACGSHLVFGSAELVDDLAGRFAHLGKQVAGQKDGRLARAELDLCFDRRVERLQKTPALLLGEIAVESRA